MQEGTDFFTSNSRCSHSFHRVLPSLPPRPNLSSALQGRRDMGRGDVGRQCNERRSGEQDDGPKEDRAAFCLRPRSRSLCSDNGQMNEGEREGGKGGRVYIEWRRLHFCVARRQKRESQKEERERERGREGVRERSEAVSEAIAAGIRAEESDAPMTTWRDGEGGRDFAETGEEGKRKER